MGIVDTLAEVYDESDDEVTIRRDKALGRVITSGGNVLPGEVGVGGSETSERGPGKA